MLSAFGRNEEAIEAEKKAMELDPFERPFAMAFTYFLARQYDAAINEARLRLKTRPDDISLHWALWEAYRRKGAEKEAAQGAGKIAFAARLDELGRSHPPPVRAWRLKAVVLGQVDYYKKLSEKQYVSPLQRAMYNAQLGRREETLALLEEGYQQHDPELLWIQNDPATISSMVTSATGRSSDGSDRLLLISRLRCVTGVGGHRSVTRGTVSTDISASGYKSTPLGRKTGFPAK